MAVEECGWKLHSRSSTSLRSCIAPMSLSMDPPSVHVGGEGRGREGKSSVHAIIKVVQAVGRQLQTLPLAGPAKARQFHGSDRGMQLSPLLIGAFNFTSVQARARLESPTTTTCSTAFVRCSPDGRTSTKQRASVDNMIVDAKVVRS